MIAEARAALPEPPDVADGAALPDEAGDDPGAAAC